VKISYTIEWANDDKKTIGIKQYDKDNLDNPSVDFELVTNGTSDAKISKADGAFFLYITDGTYPTLLAIKIREEAGFDIVGGLLVSDLVELKTVAYHTGARGAVSLKVSGGNSVIEQYKYLSGIGITAAAGNFTGNVFVDFTYKKTLTTQFFTVLEMGRMTAR
jgi:hypothetical protein